MKRAFISFDYDHDEDLRNLLVGQARNPDSPFQIADWSVKEAFSGNWQEKARQRIRQTDLTIVMCGQFTHLATGVATEQPAESVDLCAAVTNHFRPSTR